MVGAGVTSGCGKGGCVPGMLEITLSYAASIAFACLVSMLGANESRGSEPRTPGPQPDGSVVLPNQWSLRPVGRQVDVGDFPAAIAVHPSGSHAVVLHCGYGPHELVVLDVQSRRVVSRVAIDESFHGVAFNPAGSMVYASGGGGETILPFRFESGVLVPLTPIRLRDEKERGVPAGIALTSDGRTLVVANVWGHSVTRVRLCLPADGRTPSAHPGGRPGSRDTGGDDRRPLHHQTGRSASGTHGGRPALSVRVCGR